MEKLISQMFSIRDTAHKLHLATKSFALHLALGDFYDTILALADSLAETYQGKYGILNIPKEDSDFAAGDARSFINAVAVWAEESRNVFNPEDTHLLNEWDNVLAAVYKAKYKIENLA